MPSNAAENGFKFQTGWKVAQSSIAITLQKGNTCFLTFCGVVIPRLLGLRGTSRSLATTPNWDAATAQLRAAGLF